MVLELWKWEHLRSKTTWSPIRQLAPAQLRQPAQLSQPEGVLSVMLKWTHQQGIQPFSYFYSSTFAFEWFQTVLRDPTMPIMGLTWDPAFLRTRAGITLALESGVGLLGALIGFVLANGFESFLMWGAFFASGFFLFTHVTNLTQSLESRFPYLAKIVSSIGFAL